MVNLVHDTLTLGVMVISRKTEWLAGIMSLLFCCIEVFLSFFLVYYLYYICILLVSVGHQGCLHISKETLAGMLTMVEEVAKLMHLLFCEFIFFKSSLNNLIIFFHNYLADFRQHVNFCVF